MWNYDEYQKIIRYRSGYHAFLIVSILTLVSWFLNIGPEVHWGETREVEYLFILSAAFIFFNISNALQGAHFRKTENPLWNSFFSILMGGLLLFLAFKTPHFYKGSFIENGKLTFKSLQLFVILTYFSIPLSTLIGWFREKKKSRE